MATTILQSFEILKTNLEITQLQSSTTSTRQTDIRNVMASKLDVIDSFLTGSYRRNTMIAPLHEADVDIFIILDATYFYQYTEHQNGGQAGLLDLVKRTLKTTYTKTPGISRNGQAVTIKFNDFIVDVVPAFNRQGAGYLIPNSITKSWLETDPKVHIEYIVMHNKAHNGNLIPLIKMIKAWNKIINNAFVSFYLELLAVKILNNIKISDFPSGMRYFFDKGREAIKFKVEDPTAYGHQINGLKNVSTIEEAVSKFQIAYEQTSKAEEHYRNGFIHLAVGEWRKIFGDYFPAYG